MVFRESPTLRSLANPENTKGKEDPMILIYRMCPLYCQLFQMPCFLLNFLFPLCQQIQTFFKLTECQSSVTFNFCVTGSIPSDGQYLASSFFINHTFSVYPVRVACTASCIVGEIGL